MSLLYFNGDSFVAGVELGDEILPEHPGYADDMPHERKGNSIEYDWLMKSYDSKSSINLARNKYYDRIKELEIKFD